MPEPDIGRAFLDDTILQFRKYKDLADKAIAQVGDSDLFHAPDPESNSIAVILKHISGNMRSRWTDFLTTDGEKPDRDRDGEFELDGGDSKALVMERWEIGWKLLFKTLAGLSPGDLLRTVMLRGEPHTVLQAIDRQLTHYAYHVGQVVYIARHFAGVRWKSLSIPKGKSREFDVARDGKPYVLR
jgi:Protein of unknown function (DUF1572)